MIANRDVDAAWKYHNATKHSHLSIRAHPHFLDWDNKPLPFKIYPTLEVMRLSKDFKRTSMPALSAIATTVVSASGDVIPDLETLAQLLFFSAGVTKSKKYHSTSFALICLGSRLASTTLVSLNSVCANYGVVTTARF